MPAIVIEYQWRNLANEYYKTCGKEMRNLANEMSIMLIMFLEGSGGEGMGGEGTGREGRGGDGTGRDGTGVVAG